MARVIHTGDTHLGYQQYHAPQRRRDFLQAFQGVADDAIADDVDAVVHAGDLFHDRRPTLSDIMGALSVLRTLDAADVPFLAVVGNHETKRDAQWLDLFESLGLATRLGEEPIVIEDTAFYGLDFVPRSKREDLDYEFEPHTAEHAALVTHGLFEPFDFGEWSAETVLDESSVRFDAMLLGDNHAPGVKRFEDPHDAWVTYCGSTERASADERDERGYNLVEFDEDVDIRRRGLDTREFVFVDLELREAEGIERVHERLGQHDLADAVVIVSIEGAGDPIAPASVEEFAAERGALVARVTDHRERPEEADLEVSFADPDEAVRERVRDLGLSAAARDIDETVRASKVADANVADAVEDRVRDLVDGDEAGAFEPAPDDVDREGADASGGAAADGDSGSVSESEEASVEATESASAVSRTESEPAQEDPAQVDESATGAESAAEADAEEDPEDQSTMEEYL